MSITLNGSAFDLTYISVADDFEEQPGASLDVDPWGMDQITRRFNGRLDKVTTELAKFNRRRDTPDYLYKDLYAVSWSMSHDAPFPVLQVTYKGFIDGKTPLPVKKSGERSASVSLGILSMLGTFSGTTKTIRYKAPYTQFKYWIKGKPTGARYRNQVELTNDSFQRIRMNGDQTQRVVVKKGPDLNGGGSGTVTITGVAGAANAIIEIDSTLDYEQVAGPWYAVTETNTAVLAQKPQAITLSLM